LVSLPFFVFQLKAHTEWTDRLTNRRTGKTDNVAY